MPGYEKGGTLGTHANHTRTPPPPQLPSRAVPPSPACRLPDSRSRSAGACHGDTLQDRRHGTAGQLFQGTQAQASRCPQPHMHAGADHAVTLDGLPAGTVGSHPCRLSHNHLDAERAEEEVGARVSWALQVNPELSVQPSPGLGALEQWRKAAPAGQRSPENCDSQEQDERRCTAPVPRPAGPTPQGGGARPRPHPEVLLVHVQLHAAPHGVALPADVRTSHAIPGPARAASARLVAGGGGEQVSGETTPTYGMPAQRVGRPCMRAGVGHSSHSTSLRPARLLPAHSGPALAGQHPTSP